jgi:DNA repair protein RadC
VFACLFLDSAHRILAFREIFTGSINTATVHPREVVKKALQLNAAAVILAHNHPSGESNPSDKDIELTHTLKDILKIIDVRVLDHLVIGEEIYSFADCGLLNKRNQHN